MSGDNSGDNRDDRQRQQDRALTAALRAAQWELDNVAHALPAGRVTPEGWKDLLTALDYLRDLVRMRSGDQGGPSIDREPPTE